MVITAFIIIFVFSYFYIAALRDRKKNIQIWEKIGQIEEESTVKGSISRVFQEKRRFYQSKWIWHTEMQINQGGSQIEVIVENPIQEEKTDPPHVQKGDQVICYGRFHDRSFLANRIEFVKEKAPVF